MLTIELPCITFEEKLLVREGLHFGVPASFLQDRAMGKINANTANMALFLFFLEKEDHG